MARVNASFIDYDSHYYRMIGEWDITPEEAFKRFYNFLRDFKFIGTFHYYMNKEFGSYSQLYKQYFIERVNNYQRYCNMANKRHNRLYHKGANLYHWYDDLVLLFPFAFNNEDAYDRYGRISYGRLHYITELWRMYCSEYKIIHSIIQVKEEEDETMADNPRYSWSRQFWKNAVSQYEDKVEKVIFLGDYLDPYPDEGITRKDAIRNFEEIIDYKTNNKDKVVLLLGNHDLHYWSKEFHTRSRYDSSNAYHIIEDFKTHRSLFELAHEETVGDKKYLFSHAGLMNSWVERNKRVIDEITPDSLTRLLYSANGVRTLTDISSYRSWFGEDSGSIVWSDVREKINLDDSLEYNIIPNADSIVEGYDYQIFGHTQQNKDPMITDKWACLDCRKAFILDEDGVLTQVTDEKTE